MKRKYPCFSAKKTGFHYIWASSIQSRSFCIASGLFIVQEWLAAWKSLVFATLLHVCGLIPCECWN